MSKEMREQIDKIKNFGQFLNENNDNLIKLYNIAKGVDYNTFLKKTDSLAFEYDMLYRGSVDELENNIFMTDYIGHAFEYGDVVNGILYNPSDVMFFNDNTFSSLRQNYRGLSKEDLLKIYNSDKIIDIDAIDFVFKFIQSDVPYTKVNQNFDKNDLLVPIMQYYAKSKGKNIISFLGSDYDGDQNEFIVDDISKYKQLKDVWSNVNKM